MSRYFVVDARFSFTKDPHQEYKFEAPEPCTKSSRGKTRRARSGSISISSLNNLPVSPVNRFAQSTGPERTNPSRENRRRHTAPAMSTRRADYYFAEPWDLSYGAKSNRRSIWQRFTENVDKCVFRVVSKFYK
ncbi:unnamed protein product [Phytophthora lilii]|uniref:Unnamed protein product n=1 Tax=Phytophthora lilii TaxID=2077276 RepID=A0A9W7CJC8_9STRA|nr:unnamed protein product [Phytophthora lilii]